ncbi:hypothetical protein PMIN01_12300 [Paraphaeosphaeria minitans]|uniref:Uncharacterized protein n=1 Tax=Paraphaeosphaeria minitans TaxID=565426 RepID=A0A9P6G6C6_9PLEO|nr:hypothetical protein PMIN01_12300 [Paraphaeosphaeria minitans]
MIPSCGNKCYSSSRSVERNKRRHHLASCFAMRCAHWPAGSDTYNINTRAISSAKRKPDKRQGSSRRQELERNPSHVFPGAVKI